MRKLARQSVLLLAMLLAASTAAAGQQSITGRVTDSATGAPVEGAAVRVQPSGPGATTDAEGRYQLTGVAANASLAVSALNYTTQTVAVGGRTEIDIALAPAAIALNELVVVGYTTQSRRTVSDAVASVSSEELAARKVATVTEALKGRVAGVTVTATGEPGEAARVNVRGVNFMGDNGPLYVIDGMYSGNNRNIDPNDIASIEVLKDASAAAQYGARAANGVIVITTKKGRAGAPKVTLDSYYGVQSVPNRIQLAGSAEWAEIARAAALGAGTKPPRGAAEDFDPTIDTDWQGALFQRGSIQSHTLAVSGGSAAASYRISGGYLDQEGTIIDSGFQRYNLRVNSEARRGIFRFGEHLTVSRIEKNNITGSPLIEALRMPPSIPLYDSTTTSGFGFGNDRIPTFATNPVGQQLLNQNTDRTNQALGNVYAEVGLLDALSYRFNLGFQYNDNTSHDFAEMGQLRFNNALLPAHLWQDRNSDQMLLFENLLNFDRAFGSHGLDAVLGYTEQLNEGESLGAYREDYSDETLQVIGAGTANLNNRGGKQVNNLRSFLARGTYNYADRYLLTGSFRRDGSSRFGPSNRWGNFLSGSVAWIMSGEDFYSSIPVLGSHVNYLKLRASYGNLGNQDLSNYEFAGLIEQNRSYVLGPDAHIAPGATQIDLSNPDIRWQSNTMSNFGADLELFDSQLSVSADYYISKSGGLLVQPPIPSSVGARTGPYVNLGTFRNSGLELELTHNLDRGDFQLRTGVNLTTINNEVLALGNDDQPLFAGPGGVARTAVGGPVGAFYLWQADGIFQSEEEVEAHTSTLENGTVKIIQPNAVPGDVRYVDQNGDGKINDEDRRIAGSPFADLEGGLFFDGNFRQLDFTVGLRGSLGRDIYNDPLRWTDRMDDAGSGVRAGIEPWTPENHSTTTPRAVTGPKGAFNGNILSDRWLDDGSFVRVQNVQLGYRVPASVAQHAGLGTARPRIYVNVQNLHTFTNYSSWDPEVVGPSTLSSGVDTGDIYPNPRTVSVGVNLEF